MKNLISINWTDKKLGDNIIRWGGFSTGICSSKLAPKVLQAKIGFQRVTKTKDLDAKQGLGIVDLSGFEEQLFLSCAE